MPTDTEILDALAKALNSGLIEAVTVRRSPAGVTIVVGPVSTDGADLRTAARGLISWIGMLPP